MNKTDIPLTFQQKLYTSITSASLAEICTMPLDSVKVNMQAQIGRNNTSLQPNYSMIQSIRNIYSTRGVSGFYQSWFPSITRAGLSNGLRLGSYDYMKTNVQLDRQFYGGQFVQAGLCGLFSNFMAMPMDVVKTRIQARLTEQPIKFNPLIRQIYQEGGISGFYRGFWQLAQRNILLSSLQLPTYFNLQELLSKYFGDNSNYPINHNIRTGIASTGTTIFVTSVVYPFDLCKTLVQDDFQKKKMGSLRLMKYVVVDQKVGVSGLYRGFWVMIGRCLPHFALTTFFYENLKRVIV